MYNKPFLISELFDGSIRNDSLLSVKFKSWYYLLLSTPIAYPGKKLTSVFEVFCKCHVSAVQMRPEPAAVAAHRPAVRVYRLPASPAVVLSGKVRWFNARDVFEQSSLMIIVQFLYCPFAGDNHACCVTFGVT